MGDVKFRRLQRSDYPMLAHWLDEPHVKRWWNHDTAPEAIEADFGASIDRTDPADVFIALWGGRPVGLIQRYLFGDNPGYMAELAPLIDAPPAALSIDYFVGVADLLRQGIGAAIIRATLHDIWRDHPSTPSVIVPVSAANRASWRVLENAGFKRVAEGPLSPDNPIDDWAHFVYRVERPVQLRPHLPAADEFPPGTEFVIYEFDSPLVNLPVKGWFSWWGGVARPYDPRGRLKPDNNWNADSFEEWQAVVEATMERK